MTAHEAARLEAALRGHGIRVAPGALAPLRQPRPKLNDDDPLRRQAREAAATRGALVRFFPAELELH